MRSATRVFVLGCASVGAALGGVSLADDAQSDTPLSQTSYRLPYVDGTSVKVFDDFTTHRPQGRVDLFGVGGQHPYRVVAAAAGRIAAIQRCDVSRRGVLSS